MCIQSAVAHTHTCAHMAIWLLPGSQIRETAGALTPPVRWGRHSTAELTPKFLTGQRRKRLSARRAPVISAPPFLLQLLFHPSASLSFLPPPSCFTSLLSCLCVCLPSRVQLCVTLWTVAREIPLSMGFPRQEYWNGLPFPTPGDLPNPGIGLASPASTS